MVDKNVLNQYSDLVEEIKEIQIKITKLEEQLRKIEREGKVKDKVKGGEGGLQPFQIEGFPLPEYSKKKTLLYSRKTTLELLKDDLLVKTNDVEEFISGISDSRMRRIVNMRVLDRMSWIKIAHKIGGGNTEDSIKKAFYRFLEQN